jgi:hypothetical protein
LNAQSIEGPGQCELLDRCRSWGHRKPMLN